MNKLINEYGNDLVTVFDGKLLKDKNYDSLAVIRSSATKKEIDGILTMTYDEDFESLLSYEIPPKTRKEQKLLSYQKTLELIDRLHFCTIGCVIDSTPYTYPINHVVIDNHIYFHTGRKGYKLKALDTKACVSFTEDLGNAYNGTHNFRCAQVFGTLKQCEDYNLKKKVLEKLITHLNKNHSPYVDSMQDSCLVYEIDAYYILGRENLYLPE